MVPPAPACFRRLTRMRFAPTPKRCPRRWPSWRRTCNRSTSSCSSTPSIGTNTTTTASGVCTTSASGSRSTSPGRNWVTSAHGPRQQPHRRHHHRRGQPHPRRTHTISSRRCTLVEGVDGRELPGGHVSHPERTHTSQVLPVKRSQDLIGPSPRPGDAGAGECSGEHLGGPQPTGPDGDRQVPPSPAAAPPAPAH